MDFYNKTILGFFDTTQKSFEVPVYQRAYSWEREQWETFLDDLLEQIKGENNYSYGNVLLETVEKDKKYEIIDGQQRLTTLLIFIRSMLNVLEKRKSDSELVDFDFETKKSIFLKHSGNIKLRPVEYDRACFDSLIIDNKENFETNTPSQKKIKEAKAFFNDELNKLETDILLQVLNKIESTDLTIIELEGKKDSVLMFELENNRGKDLTNMEKIKSYFMYQMYVYSNPEETKSNIEYVSNFFKLIYLIINDLKLNEDSVLIYHNNALKGYDYRALKDVKKVFKESNDKIKWIKDYISELHTSFSNLKKFEKSTIKYAEKLKMKTLAFVYPFIIKGYKYFGDDPNKGDDPKLNTLFNLLEILIFRTRLINSRANIESRLNPLLIDFKGDLLKLKKDLKSALYQSWYWSDTNTKNHLNGRIYNINKNNRNQILCYLFGEYEDSIQNKGYKIKNFSLEEEQIEHISPQTPDGKSISMGYDVNEENEYSEDFKSKHLHSLGNLMLISRSHNASIGNKPFKDKLESYKSNPLLNQQAEIKDFVFTENGADLWKIESIEKRHKKLVEFAIKKWSFDNVDTAY